MGTGNFFSFLFGLIFLWPVLHHFFLLCISLIAAMALDEVAGLL
jgi:hypothetical protein